MKGLFTENAISNFSGSMFISGMDRINTAQQSNI